MTVRRLEPDDIGWAAKLMEDRRQEYAQYSPVFWRPRSGATGIHAGHLRQQALDPGNVAIRNDHGFLIVQPRGEEGLVDGGLVLLVDRDAVDAGPALIERDAAAAGAVLAVLPTEPADDREHELRQRGWDVASQWYLGRPEPDGSTVSEG